MTSSTSSGIVNDANFETTVAQDEGPILVEFFADWSGMCFLLEPSLENAVKQFQQEISIVEMDVEKNAQSAMTNGILEVPGPFFS